MKHYYKVNTKKAIKFAASIKGLTATLVTYAYFNDKPNMMFIIMVIGAISNEAINFLSDGTNEKNITNTPDA